LKIGLIGAGRIGAFHAQTLASQADITELRIADVDVDRAKSVAESTGASTATDADELVRWADAIVIAASTDTHADLITLGAEAGLPVFCEKPITLDLETTNRVLERVNTADIPLQIGFQRRFDPGFTAARDMLASGQLGRLYMAKLNTYDPEPAHDAYIKVSGGMFVDMLVHDFDLIRWVSGQEVVEVTAAGRALTGNPAFEQADDVDTAVAVLQLADGAMAVVSGVRHDPRGYDVRLEMHGSRDAVAAGINAQMPLKLLDDNDQWENGNEHQTFLERFESSYRQELNTFLKVAQGQMDSPCTGEDAGEALRLALVAKKSLRERRPVLVEEIR
jgi:myo-inositol 2-dehydrogenase/D-chiro-inositol 1-dehydrogenase